MALGNVDFHTLKKIDDFDPDRTCLQVHTVECCSFEDVCYVCFSDAIVSVYTF